jgi:hypothetical protein
LMCLPDQSPARPIACGSSRCAAGPAIQPPWFGVGGQAEPVDIRSQACRRGSRAAGKRLLSPGFLGAGPTSCISQHGCCYTGHR